MPAVAFTPGRELLHVFPASAHFLPDAQAEIVVLKVTSSASLRCSNSRILEVTTRGSDNVGTRAPRSHTLEHLQRLARPRFRERGCAERPCAAMCRLPSPRILCSGPQWQRCLLWSVTWLPPFCLLRRRKECRQCRHMARPQIWANTSSLHVPQKLQTCPEWRRAVRHSTLATSEISEPGLPACFTNSRNQNTLTSEMAHQSVAAFSWHAAHMLMSLLKKNSSACTPCPPRPQGATATQQIRK